MPDPFLRQKLPNVTSLVIVCLLAALYIAPFGDLDFGILIRLGELVVSTGVLMPVESFSYTINGTHVPDYEWLFEIIIWGVWTAFGYGGLKLFKVLLVSATLTVVGLQLRGEGVRWHGIALALGVAVLVLAPGWNLRPLFFSTLGLLLASWWLHDHCTGRRPLTWWLVPLMLVWANMHPGVIMGQGLLVGAIAWEWVNRILRVNPPLSGEACLRLTLIGGLALAATFVSPDPIGRLLAPFDPVVRHPIMRIFEEMRPLYQVVLTPPYQYVLVCVVAVLVLLTVILRFRDYRLWEIALLIGLAGLANMAVRSVQDWLLVMLSLGVPHLVRLLRQWSRQRRQPAVAAVLRADRFCKRLLLSPLFRFQWRWPVVALAVLAVISLIPALGRDMPLRDRERDPVAAVAWIERELQPTAGDPMLVFGPPDYASYLVWRLGDGVRVYVDTRGFCFPPELTQDAHYIPQLAGDWQERLDHVLNTGTEYFFLETYGPRSRLWHLLKEQGVTALYADEKAALLTAEQVRAGVAKWQAKQAAR